MDRCTEVTEYDNSDLIFYFIVFFSSQALLMPNIILFGWWLVFQENFEK
jgi:hypothetical protein